MRVPNMNLEMNKYIEFHGLFDWWLAGELGMMPTVKFIDSINSNLKIKSHSIHNITVASGIFTYSQPIKPCKNMYTCLWLENYCQMTN